MKRWRFLAVISAAQLALLLAHLGRDSLWLDEVTSADVAGAPWGRVWAFFRSLPEQHPLDRKSTRLNSSHSQISYAVFCLKKKKKKYVAEHTLRKIHTRSTS